MAVEFNQISNDKCELSVITFQNVQPVHERVLGKRQRFEAPTNGPLIELSEDDEIPLPDRSYVQAESVLRGSCRAISKAFKTI